MQSVVNERNAFRDQVKSLTEKLELLTGSAQQGTPVLPQETDEPIIKPGEEIDVVELDKRIRSREQASLAKVDAMINLRNAQNNAIQRINSEAAEVLRNFPELDPDSETFNPDLSESVTEAVEAYVKADPYHASPKQFVAKLMKPYQRAVAKEVGQAQETVARQVSQAALRPTHVRAVEKSAKEKSIGELEKELGVVQA